MEPLIEIPRTEWPKLCELFRANWPQIVEAYCLLDTQLTHPGLMETNKLKVYCPEGDFSNGIVAVMNQEYYEVFVCPLNENLSGIENALANTNVIDWGRSVSIPSVNAEAVASLKRLCSRRQLKITYENRVLKHILCRDSPPLEITSTPKNTYVGPLKPEHVDLVDQTWTFHDANTRQYFEHLMANGLTQVLYSSDHTPLAWISVDESGAFSHLYCVEQHRRKGYAEYITRVVSNDLLIKGKDVLVYTLEENTRSQNLFTKLGFEFFGYVWWINMTKEN